MEFGVKNEGGEFKLVVNGEITNYNIKTLDEVAEKIKNVLLAIWKKDEQEIKEKESPK